METDEICSTQPSMWEPITNQADLAILGKLGEELCEGGAAIFRCIIQGVDEKEPTTGKVNREWLRDELADIEAMIEHAKIRFNIDRYEVSKRRQRKFDFKSPWFRWLQRR